MLAAPAWAQFETATVVGTVRDATGAVVPDAKVTLTNTATGVTAEKTSDANGNFEFFTVRIGTYVVTAEKSGFSIALVDNVQVTVGARQRVDLSMATGAITETVTVSSRLILLQTDSSDRSQVITGEQTKALPLNGREYSALALLSPGVRASAIGTGGATPREGSYNVNGLRSTFNNYLIDGVDNNAYGTSNQGFSNQVMQPAPDAVGEFKVVTNNMSAEYGRSAGATINVAYASGTNTFRGAAWEFMRRTEFNASGAFRPATGKPGFDRDQWGGVLGGPIKKNKAFFFTDFEVFDQTRSQPVSQTIATTAQRAGVLAIDVRNPFTNEIYPAGTPVPMTAFARQVLNDLPAPTNSGTANNLQVLQLLTNRTPKAGGKVDIQFSPRLSAFGRVGWRDADILDNPPISGPSGGAGNARTYVNNKQFSGGVTYTPGGTSLLEARFGWSRTIAGKDPMALVLGEKPRGRGLRDHGPAVRSARGRRFAHAVDHGAVGSRTPGHQPAVAVSDRLQSEDQLHLAAGPSLAQDRLRVSARADARCRTSTRSTAVIPTPASSRVRRRRRPPTTSTTSPTSCSARARPTRSATSWWRSCSRTCTSSTCRTTGASTIASRSTPACATSTRRRGPSRTTSCRTSIRPRRRW